MGIIFMLLGGICSLVSLVCSIIILIDAFKSAVWKGIVCLVTCGLYFLYFALVEFQHEKKWLIVAGSIGLSILAGIFNMMGSAAAIASIPGQ